MLSGFLINQVTWQIPSTFHSLLRIFMVWKPLNEPVEIEPQQFEVFKRNGFIAVKWGGTQIQQPFFLQEDVLRRTA